MICSRTKITDELKQQKKNENKIMKRDDKKKKDKKQCRGLLSNGFQHNVIKVSSDLRMKERTFWSKEANLKSLQ